MPPFETETLMLSISWAVINFPPWQHVRFRSKALALYLAEPSAPRQCQRRFFNDSLETNIIQRHRPIGLTGHLRFSPDRLHSSQLLTDGLRVELRQDILRHHVKLILQYTQTINPRCDDLARHRFK